MDGTIALGDSKSGGHRALPHAIAVLETLKAAGTPFVVFTNGTAKPPAAVIHASASSKLAHSCFTYAGLPSPKYFLNACCMFFTWPACTK